MEKSHKIILGGILAGLTVANVWSIFHGHSNIAAIQNNITLSQKKIDSAMANISFSQSKLDSIQADMTKFSSYVSSIAGTVNQINISKDESDAKSNTILRELRKKASTARLELDKTDSVPPAIKIKSL